MTSLAVRAELTKLGALLSLDPKDLGYLADLDPDAIRKFREDAMDMMFEADRKRLEGSAAATKLVPIAITAKIASMLIPPRLAARIAGLIDSGKAVELASRLPVKYLADVTPFLDPRRVSAILGEVPNEMVAEVAKVLDGTGDYITMGRMVAHIKHDAIFQTLAHLSDYTLLQTGFVIEHQSRIPEIIHMLPEHRLISITEVADERGHWLEAMGLLDNLDDSLRRHLVNLVARQPHLMNGLVKCAYDEGLWDVALPLAPLMTEESLQTFVHVDVLHRPEVVESLVDAAARLDLWGHLNPLLPLVESELAVHLAHALAAISDEHLDRLVGEVTRAGLKDALDAVAVHDETLAERIANRNA
ncbi:MAG: hypothetical protein LLG14_12825 [Nocardiaceae bacterium]|nr:hypothetical protein [Nocardiaceae bacterium]